jgi:hypothetical protein
MMLEEHSYFVTNLFPVLNILRLWRLYYVLADGCTHGNPRSCGWDLASATIILARYKPMIVFCILILLTHPRGVVNIPSDEL